MATCDAWTATDVAGPPDGHCILLVHASGWTRSLWLTQIRELADCYRVVAPDLPRHGVRADEPFTMQSAVDVLVATAAAQTHGRTLLVGLSLGGYVALAYAARSPESVAGLVLAGCTVSFDRWLGLLTRISARTHIGMVRYGGPHVRKRLRDRQERVIRASLPPEIAEPQIAAGLALDVWGRALLEVARHDYHRMLAGLSCPVLVLNGEFDTYNRRAEARLARTAPKAAFHVIAGAGHIANLDQPERFTNELRSFAGTLDW